MVAEYLADAELGAAVEASIVVNVKLPLRIAPYDDVHSQPLQAERRVGHMGRLTNRVPHVSQAELQLGFEFDL
jgi:hypothetical protein